MRQRSIRSKLLFSIGVLAAGYLCFLGLAQWTASMTQKRLALVTESIYPAALSVNRASSGFQKLTEQYRESVLLQDANALNAAAKDAEAIRAELKNVQDKTAYDAELHAQAVAVATGYASVVERSKSVYRQMLEHPDDVSEETQAKLAALVKDDESMKAALLELNDALGKRAIGAELHTIDAANSRQRLLAMGMFLVAVGFAAGTILLMERQVSAPLRELAERLADGARRVASSAQEVSASGQSLADGSSSQAASLEETSASSQEISSMAQRSAENCRSTAELVTMSQRKFEETNQSLGELLTAMDEINASGGRVSKIIKVIDEIAFQTNILALNAAVEAARAGEAGMGFAVVADEVRNLAQRCANAARDSAEIIAESIDRSQLGKKKLDDVASSIASVTSESMKVKVFVDQINAASTEQTRGIHQIAQSISLMEKVTQKSAATAEESAAAAQELTVQSDLMNEIVSSLSLVVSGG